MIMQLVVAFALICATVGIHALGTLEAIWDFARKSKSPQGGQGLWVSELWVVRIVCGLLLLHFVEACAWAGFYWMAGLLPDFETSVYFSITSYTTVGYGDVVLPSAWRLLGPIEAAIGILMFGWSTGILVTVLSKVYSARLKLPEDSSAIEDRSSVVDDRQRK